MNLDKNQSRGRMSRGLAHLVLVSLLEIVGCTGEDIEPMADLPRCEALEIALADGSCIRPGIPPDGCANGFAHDGEYGCEPILPPEPCAPGLMAVPGESECRPVRACAAGTWGDLPVDASTEYVDAAYTGLDSDGTAAQPWTTITQAVATAASGALIAVAEGSYTEDVLIATRPVRLWGVCPEKVEIVGTGGELYALAIGQGASGAEVRGLAVRGAADGLFVSRPEYVTIDGVWVHDTAGRGIGIQSVSVEASVSGTLVERTQDHGLFIAASVATVEATVVRATQPVDPVFGNGIVIQPACTQQSGCNPMARSSATVRRSVVEASHGAGLFVMGSDAIVEGTVVRGTLPRASDQAMGRGLNVQLTCLFGVCDSSARASATVRGSLVEQNHEFGVLVSGSDAIVESTVVRGTLPEVSSQVRGAGLGVQLSCQPGGCDPTARATATVRSSLIDGNHELGLFVGGSEATVEATVVRGTLPAPLDGLYGDGVVAFGGIAASTATITGSRINDNARAGLATFGAFVSVGATALECNGVDLTGERHETDDFTFEDRGENSCGCPPALGACRAVSAGLVSPRPIE